ncbi:hypothetical protein SMICM17S_00244 [Streptomyces microflavus]
MTTLAPAYEPEAKPITSGEPSGFFVSDWKSAPLTASAAPQTTANSSRGSRQVTTTSRVRGSASGSKSAESTWAGVSWMEPVARVRTPRAATTRTRTPQTMTDRRSTRSEARPRRSAQVVRPEPAERVRVWAVTGCSPSGAGPARRGRALRRAR